MCVTASHLQQTLFAHPAIQSFNGYSQAVFRKLQLCHTALMGMHRFQCNDPDCKHVHWQYHSCGNRHCPNCGSSRTEAWIDFKMTDLLPTGYYHVVFTLPHELNGLIMGNRSLLFKLLFQAAAHTLLTLAKDEKYLGGEPGITSVLHTWGQDLSFHPHIHCIVSGGGVRKGRWVAAKRKNNTFLFPKAAMQKIYKGFFMHQLRRLHKNGQLAINEIQFHQLLTTIGLKKWNVYAKKPFGGPQQVVEYLGRYTHKVAITRHRIEEISEKTITFRYKDYADGNKSKLMNLSQPEFLRRFEQHILPKGFVKIRNYGFLKNYNKTARLNELRLKMKLPPAPKKIRIPAAQRLLEKYGRDVTRCPKCEKGMLLLMETVRPYYDYRIRAIPGRGKDATPKQYQSP